MMRLRALLFVAALLGPAPFTWAGTPSLSVKLDHFGYRPADRKIAVFTADPGATVQVRNLADTVLYTVPTDGGSISSQGADAHSGDNVWWVDFSGFTTAGSYRLYSSSLGAQSYNFEIRNDIYNAPGLAALKTYYYQRCGVAKPAAYAGAEWADAGACHLGDANCTAHAGHSNHGTRDLSGGWHDAGDHNKYAWYAVTDSVYFMLRAFEDNPSVYSDGQLNIPESGNGVPDILDEMKFELDWLLKMQLPDGSVLDRVRAADGVYTVWAPPSADTTTRYYKDPTNDSAATLAVSCAIGARIFEAQGQAAYAATLRAAANAAWAWLQPRAVSADEAPYKVFAAAEVFRTDPTQVSARTHVDGYVANWATHFYNMDHFDIWAAHTYIRTPAATATVVNSMRAGINGAVNAIFSNDDKYLSGMQSWYYYWGSNRPRAKHGLFLLHAVDQGLTGSRTAAQVREKAQGYLHYFHGRNPLSMVYLTHMAALGGEHSSWMFYHGWFGDSNNTYSRTRFLGKPAGIVEPHYPYYAGTDNHGVNDNRSATYGPPPGYVPGGVNASYTGSSIPPSGITQRNKAYRDWAWQSAGSAPNTWEITENSISSQGPYVALAAYFMAPSAAYSPTPSFTPSPVVSATPTPTAVPTVCAVPLNMAESLTENGTWSGANATRSIVAAGSAPAGAVTQGGSALRVQVATGAGWNDAIMNLQGFSPAVIGSATHLSLDLHVSAGLAGSAWNSLMLYGSCASCPGGKWYRQLAAGVALVAGANQVRFELDYSLDSDADPMLPGDAISQILLIHSRESAATGDFYIDNMRLEGVCWTPTPTRSPSPTHTPTRTASPTRSPTPSHTPSPSATITPSLTSTLGAGSPTPTATPPDPGSSPTDTPPASATATPSASPVDSATLTPTATPPDPGSSPSPSVTSTLSLTSTPDAGSPTATASPTLTATPSDTPGGPSPATATATPAAAGEGPLVIEQITGFPQPNPTHILLKLQGQAQRVRVRLYSPAKVLLAELESPGGGPGWIRVPLTGLELPNGLSYYSAQALRGTVRSEPAKGALYRIR
jgi:hypothetical protein